MDFIRKNRVSSFLSFCADQLTHQVQIKWHYIFFSLSCQNIFFLHCWFAKSLMLRSSCLQLSRKWLLQTTCKECLLIPELQYIKKLKSDCVYCQLQGDLCQPSGSVRDCGQCGHLRSRHVCLLQQLWPTQSWQDFCPWHGNEDMTKRKSYREAW